MNFFKQFLLCFLAAACLFTAPALAREQEEAAVRYLQYNDPDMTRGVGWDLNMLEIAALENGTAWTRTVTVTKNVTLYGFEVSKLSYGLVNDVLMTRKFALAKNNKDVFGALFFSLLMRYGDPATVRPKKIQWEMIDMWITLERGDDLTVIFERKAKAL